MNVLIRESDDCFREPNSDRRDRGLDYYRLHQKLRVEINRPYRISSNLSDSEFDWFDHSQFRASYRKAIIDGKPLPSPPKAMEGVGRDQVREYYKITGRGKSNDHLYLITGDGKALKSENFTVEIEKKYKTEESVIAFYTGHESDDTFFNIRLRVSDARLIWLWDQIGSRKGAALETDIEFKAFVREDRVQPYNSNMHKELFIDGTTRIDGVSFHVVDPEVESDRAR